MLLHLPLQSQPPAWLFVWPAHAALPEQPVLLALPSVSAHHRDGICIHHAAQVRDIPQQTTLQWHLSTITLVV